MRAGSNPAAATSYFSYLELLSFFMLFWAIVSLRSVRQMLLILFIFNFEFYLPVVKRAGFLLQSY